MYVLNAQERHLLLDQSAISFGSIDEAIRSSSNETLCEIAKSMATSGKDLHQLYLLNNGEALDLCIAQNPNTLAPTLNGLTQRSDNYPLRFAIAKHDNTSKEALTVIGLSSIEALLTEVAKNKNTSIESRLQLADQSYLRVRMALATSPYICEQLLMKMLSTTLEKAVRTALLTNAYIAPETLNALVSHGDQTMLPYLAQNTSLPKEAFMTLAKLSFIDVLKGIAKNPSAPETLLVRLAPMDKGGVSACVASNPSTPTSSLKSLSLSPIDHVREMVANNPNTEDFVLALLAKDGVDLVRKGVASNPNASLEALRSLASDRVASVSRQVALNPALGIVTELKGSSVKLKEDGFGCFDFYGVMSPKKVAKMFIGSKHPQEVAFLFNAKNCDNLTAISRIQSAFTNENNGKLDRDGYIRFLTQVNEYVPYERTTGLAVESEDLKVSLTYFDTDLLLSAVMQYDVHEARDIFRMIGSISRLPIEVEQKEELDDLRQWLVRNNKTKNPKCFHHHLVKKNIDLFDPNREMFFWQKNLAPEVKRVQSTLPKGVVLNFPITTVELRDIGDKQNHCVGTQYYAERCLSGANIIFQLAPNGNVKHGYTFQFSRDGKLLQAKGFSNSRVPSDMISLAKKTLNAFNNKNATLPRVA